jgi:hypothetical protein
MNTFTLIGIVVLTLAAVRLAYIVTAALNPGFVVLAVYRAILLLPEGLAVKAGVAWWAYMNKNCSRERLCVECAREQQAQRRAEGA